MNNLALSESDIYRRISEFILEIRQFVNNEFKEGEWYFCIIYGSYAYKTATIQSDLDVLFVCDDPSLSRIARAVNFTNSLHKKYNMPLDHEIPYDKKLILDRQFFESACNAQGAYLNGNWQLPAVEKKPEVLSSDALLLRFLMGMMFNPHIFVSGDYASYNHYAMVASKNLLRAIISINKLETFTARELVQYVCVNNGNTGDLFVGFINDEPHISYLLERIEIVLSSMPKYEIIKTTGDSYQILNNTDLKPGVIC